MNKLSSCKDFENYQSLVTKSIHGKKIISICSGSGCRAYGSVSVFKSFEEHLKKNNLTDKVILKQSGCHGYCERGPVVIIHPEKILYVSVKPEDTELIITKTIMKNEVVESLIWKDGNEKAEKEGDIPFYKNQSRILLTGNSLIDPANIDDYIAQGGYSALVKAFSKIKPEEVLAEVKKSKIRGRGGAGFPAGTKWEATRNAEGTEKYVVVNGDEGDPGAFMDGSLLEGNPHSVLEGLILGGYAIGASKGFFYIRQEYPLARESVTIAIEQARKLGLLGENILGSGFSFDVELHRGAGAFVSGESSALLSAIEGNVGEPKLKYIRMSQKGLWDKPTNLNNVETWANIPLIINNGSDWFTKIGTQGSTGTKIFSLVGQVRNTGLVEVPMGTTLRKIIYDIGGGIKNGKKFKAVQIGGPSGGCLPKEYLDTPIDYDELTKHGAMMGSGGMIVMDENSCMVDIAKYFLHFLVEESCGKCMPCREGTKELYTILERISNGQGVMEDLDFIADICDLLRYGSLCALGGSAMNPVETAVKYFKDEFISHIVDKKCTAKVCKSLIKYTIAESKCTGCGSCAKVCAVKAIDGEKAKVHTINQKKCTKCGVCIQACPAKIGAISKESPVI
jgi:NADH:ubiquinone oxidoreductase subunit F (NADH-binding)/(2Fe-2S) ferredoxin/NAD-dependent dihydropyrimidine dehydrogenase PreA subunit